MGEMDIENGRRADIDRLVGARGLRESQTTQ
jgi:hypothetical protein